MRTLSTSPTRNGSAGPAMLGGILLMVATVTALVVANSPWADEVNAFWHQTLSISLGKLALAKPLELWINDGLMAIFFFAVGLELKREIVYGELRSVRQAAVPILAAIGGMAVPALLYFGLTAGGPGARGWGIPMATDIAFALGVLSLLGSRVPVSLRVFLATLAVVDDLGAVLVIAIFYTDGISFGMLGIAGLLLGAAVIANRCGARQPLIYLVIGAALWLATLKSGVHATIAGVALAFTIPLKPLRKSDATLREIAATVDAQPAGHERLVAAYALEQAAILRGSPAFNLELLLIRPIALVIMPIFALSNAGVSLHDWSMIRDPIAMGVGAGLVLGKPIGVCAGAWLAVKCGIGRLADDLRWVHILGAGCLAGIGFTMALFVTGLAFTEESQQDAAKLGILLASLTAGILAAVVLLRARNAPPHSAPAAAAA